MATKQSIFLRVDCFAEFIIGRRLAPTRWLAMTKDLSADPVIASALLTHSSIHR